MGVDALAGATVELVTWPDHAMPKEAAMTKSVSHWMLRRADAPETVVVAAADPLNLVGILVPGTRIPPAAREVVAFRDGAAVESGELGAVLSRLSAAAAARPAS